MNEQLESMCQDAELTKTVQKGARHGNGSSNCAGRAGHHRFIILGVIGNNTKLEPVHDVVATVQYGGYGVEVEMDSLAKDGSQSWVVISRSVERYVTKLYLDCTEPMQVDTSTLGTEKLVALIPWKGQRGASSSSQQDDAHVPIGHWECEVTHSVDKLVKVSYPISKIEELCMCL